MILQPLTKNGQKTTTQKTGYSSSPNVLAPLTKKVTTPSPTPTKKIADKPKPTPTKTPEKPSLQSSIMNAVKGFTMSLIPQKKVISPIPDSQVIKPTIPDKKISILPGQKYLQPEQLKKIFPQTAQAITETGQAAKELSQSKKVDIYSNDTKKIKQAGVDAWNAIKDPFIEQIKREQERLRPNQSIVERNASTLKAYTGMANVAFSPVNAVFAALNNSNMKVATQALAVPFVLAGEGAEKVSNRIIDELPLDKKTKETLKPAFAEAASLAAQIALGKFAEVSAKKAKATVNNVGSKTFEKFTKNVIDESGSARTVNVTKEQARDVLRNLGEKEVVDLFKTLDMKDRLQAVKNGGTFEIPAEKIVRIVDKPYWEKIKSTFGIKPTEITKVTQGAATKTGETFGGYITDGTYAPQEAIGIVVKNGLDKTPEGKALIKTSLEAQRQGMDILIEKEADASLLKSEQAIEAETKATPQSEKIQKELQDKQQAIEESKAENIAKKSILEQYSTNGIRAMRAIKRSVAVLEKKGLDPTSVSTTQSYKDHIQSVMEALNTTSEDVALNYIINDLPDALTSASTRQELQEIRVLKSRIEPKEVSVPRSQLPVGEGKPTVSSVEARAKGMKDTISMATPEQLNEMGFSMSNTAKNDQQLSDAAKYVSDNPNEALKVAQGKIEPPEGLLRFSVYVALTELAKTDMTLATKLVGLTGKRFGQEIQILSQLDPNSPVKLMNEVYKVREEAFKKKYRDQKPAQVRKKVEKQIKESVKKPDKYDWNNFISALEC